MPAIQHIRTRNMVECLYCHKRMRQDHLARHQTTCKQNICIDGDGPEVRGGHTFFVTWQSHVRDLVADKLDRMPEVVQYVICNEKGGDEVDHEHSHGMIIFHDSFSKNFAEFKLWVVENDIPPYGDVNAVRNLRSCCKYVSKEDYLCRKKAIPSDLLSLLKQAWMYAQKVERWNALHYPFCGLTVQAQRQFQQYYNQFANLKMLNRAKLHMDHAILYEWQRCAYIKLKEQDERTVMWIYDVDGNLGKTFLSQYIQTKEDCIILENGGKKDLAFAYNLEEYVVFDFTRSTEEHINYSFIEALKNGRLFSSKYESNIKIFKPAKVICMANFIPDRCKLSADRWLIWELLDKNNYVEI